MRKDLKTSGPIGSTIDHERLNQLRVYSKEWGVPISKWLDKAIKIQLASVRKQQTFIVFYKEFSTAHVPSWNAKYYFQT